MEKMVNLSYYRDRTDTETFLNLIEGQPICLAEGTYGGNMLTFNKLKDDDPRIKSYVPGKPHHKSPKNWKNTYKKMKGIKKPL